MAPVRKNTIEHFTHPGHPLTYLAINTQFLCDGCKILGNGNRYRCNTCDFDLHEYCGTCPTSFSSFLHPIHQLTLVVRKPQGARQNERVCDVCGTHVNGLFYRCKLCEFDVHPLCTQLPQHTRHPYHPNHVLKLQPQPTASSSGWCMVCKTTCSSWGYRCGVCDFDIHLQCVNSAPVNRPRSVTPAPAAPDCYSVYASEVYVDSGSGSSSVSGSARVLNNEYQNFSLGQGGGGGGSVNGVGTYGDDLSYTIAYWETSTWLDG